MNTTPMSEYYKVCQSIMLEIKAYKSMIACQESELKRLVANSGPGDVHALDYSEPVRDDRPWPSEFDAVNRIAELSWSIPLNKTTLAEKEETLRKLMIDGRAAAKKTNDLMLKVFVMSVFDGKKNEEIAEETNYTLKHIIRQKTKLNKLFSNMRL